MDDYVKIENRRIHGIDNKIIQKALEHSRLYKTAIRPINTCQKNPRGIENNGVNIFQITRIKNKARQKRKPGSI